MTLFYPYYISDNPDRYNEILLCLRQNINNNNIDSIIIVAQDSLDSRATALLSDKCIVWNLGKRLTYADVFRYANEHIDPTEVCILLNSDIFLDDTINILHNLQRNMFACITRYNYTDGVITFINKDFMMRSQDTWVFYPNIPDAMIDASTFFMGVNGCDNRIAMVAKEHGYTITNPALSVRTIHVHTSQHRTYRKDTGLSGAYLFVWPHTDVQPAYTEYYNIKW